MAQHRDVTLPMTGDKIERRRIKLRTTDILPFLFLLPFAIPFLLLFVWPLLHGFYLSFTDYHLIKGTSNFVGFRNYINLFLHDPVFLTSLKNTLLFVALNVPVVVIVALGLALLLSYPLKGKALFRAVFVTPYFISGAATAILFQFIFLPSGLVNYYLGKLGIQSFSLETSTVVAICVIVLITVWWRVGLATVVFLAGIEDIPDQFYEAARVDGAGSWQCFRYITLPLLRPVMVFVIIIRLIATFSMFDQVYLVTQGGPYGSTRVLLQYLYETAFSYYNLGSGSAIGWILFFLILSFSLFQLRYLRLSSAYDR
ncbi:MAG: sugar ABC transporter permease [Candidatus Rokubacteria bacterium]|nr:sugar ABC transporter permease [Candidatus Rokubacteria bacterium]